ncbi:cisplatin damage response ATP-dependent DNA ligase [Phaeobacter italicus]|uniref:cisplatin damage response ATP-dependent DNA ligase n=1 Tax=Phaeobacter italicus TaxID=481446 RepID=UPI00242F507D|nr:cisplatin damage response ATP-dependent DNA ligase [Phaeobacter italicus]MCI5100991.1 cisplatin damage response ATP-dependent DNA ligase [Phaeobacter italicus]
MQEFAELLEKLAFTPSRNGKIAHLKQAFKTLPDPDRGLALAALTGDLALRNVTPSLLRGLVADETDPELFRLSYDFVGDLAETVALIWPHSTEPEDHSLREAVEELGKTAKAELPALIMRRLSSMTPTQRYAYLKLATGGLRVGVSARLARTALAQFGSVPVEEIEELWHGLSAPYLPLFQWLEGGDKPVNLAAAPFRPVMLSTPTDLDDLSDHPPVQFVAEWKWDGIRVQATNEGGTRRLYSRTGEDISNAFPDVVDALNFEGTLDGELLIKRGDTVAPFGDLQKRLGRKRVGKAMLDSHPAALRAYDLLLWDGRDMRSQPFDARRAALSDCIAALNDPRIDLSALLSFSTWDDLARLRENPPDSVIEGVMIKRRDSAYIAGRKRGNWFKWKRDPMLVDAVLLYAQRGHGKRSGYYSDFTFGVWQEGQLVPVGKAYFGFTDAELKELDRFVRNNTTDRFGPVRAVKPELVVEVAFEGLNASSRHKSGVAMRFPRINRIRTDKPAAEAGTLEELKAFL